MVSLILDLVQCNYDIFCQATSTRNDTPCPLRVPQTCKDLQPSKHCKMWYAVHVYPGHWMAVHTVLMRGRWSTEIEMSLPEILLNKQDLFLVQFTFPVTRWFIFSITMIVCTYTKEFMYVNYNFNHPMASTRLYTESTAFLGALWEQILPRKAVGLDQFSLWRTTYLD